MSTGHQHAPGYVPTWPMISIGQIINGLLQMFVAFLLIGGNNKADRVLERADRIISDHEEDMDKLSATARSRNEMLRLLGEKAGVNAAEMDEAFGIDTLANHKPKSKRRRMTTP